MTATNEHPQDPGVTGRHSVQRIVMRPWTHLDLFSGVGGFALAARWTGWTTIGFSEIDPYACKVLEKHWPGVPNYGDVRTVPAVECDLITGGFPCQPFSCAGKRRGAADDRHLWPAMLAVIERCRPAWVLGENVPGIIGMVLHDVLSDLAAIGYQSQVFVVPACAVDARHRRDRVWIVAHHDCGNGGAPRSGEIEGRATDITESGGESECDVAHSPDIKGCCENDNGGSPAEDFENGLSWKSKGGSGPLANPQEPRLERREPARHPRAEGLPAQCGEALPDARCGSSEGNRPGEFRCEEPARWLPEPDVGRVADGVPNRVDRLKGLGNAIVPQVAAVFLDAISRAHNAPGERPAESAHPTTPKTL